MEDSEPEPFRAGRPRVGLAVVALTWVLAAVLAYWAYPREAGEGERFGPSLGSPAPQTASGSVGTSGAGEPPGIEREAEPAVEAPPVIRELDTITGSVDGQQLIGQRVDLHVAVQAVPNDVVFWAGAPDNRVLVVLAHDARRIAERPRGEPPHHILTVHPGQYATVSGSIQRIPGAEEMRDWHLTQSELAEAVDRTLYIRAETVAANGHGTH